MEGLHPFLSGSNIAFSAVFLITFISMYYLHKKSVNVAATLISEKMLESDSIESYEKETASLKTDMTIVRWVLRTLLILFIVVEVLVVLSGYLPISCP